MSALESMTIVGWERDHPTPIRSQLDARVENFGSIFLIEPLTESAEEWFDENVSDEANWFAGKLAVEHRFIVDIVGGMQDSGLAVQ